MTDTRHDESGTETPAASRVASPARGGRARPTHAADPASAASRARRRALQTEVIALFNEQRASHGLVALEADARLAAAAQAHSADMLRRGYFAHDDAHGTWDDRIRRYVRRRVVGEILSFGSGEYATPAGMVQTWMRSPEHRGIILTPDLRRVGLGVATGVYQGQDAVSMATADFSSAA